MNHNSLPAWRESSQSVSQGWQPLCGLTKAPRFLPLPVMTTVLIQHLHRTVLLEMGKLYLPAAWPRRLVDDICYYFVEGFLLRGLPISVLQWRQVYLAESGKYMLASNFFKYMRHISCIFLSLHGRDSNVNQRLP